MLRAVVNELYTHSGETILLLAYTNRAVDEICQVLNEISEQFDNNYIRIGSKYATTDPFRDRLFDRLLADIDNRKDLLQLIRSTRIYVSTVSSILGKKELFGLIDFGTVIVDEASQILEPGLVGLCGRFSRFILIGDHNQLPAVVTQPPRDTKISDDRLLQIGLLDTRNSLFERLINICAVNKWDHAYARLSYQGRMHSDIMGFTSKQFYDDQLNVLPSLPHLIQQNVPFFKY